MCTFAAEVLTVIYTCHGGEMERDSCRGVLITAFPILMLNCDHASTHSIV